MGAEKREKLLEIIRIIGEKFIIRKWCNCQEKLGKVNIVGMFIL